MLRIYYLIVHIIIIVTSIIIIIIIIIIIMCFLYAILCTTVWVLALFTFRFWLLWMLLYRRSTRIAERD